MRSTWICVWLVAANLVCGHVSAASIDASARAEVYFSGQTTRDEIVAAITGKDCENAVFTLSIRNAGTLLFQLDIPFRELTWCDIMREEGQQRKSARGLVNEAVSVKRAESVGCRQTTGCWEGPEYARLRRAEAAVVCFSTGVENSTCVAYDPESKQVVEVRRYSE